MAARQWGFAMKQITGAIVVVRDYLRRHPAYLAAAGFLVTAALNAFAGRQEAATDALVLAGAAVGVRLGVGSRPVTPKDGAK